MRMLCRFTALSLALGLSLSACEKEGPGTETPDEVAPDDAAPEEEEDEEEAPGGW